ncbi:hypothetical protein AQV86_02480 [Nanohaloarchaea archaeon SG9]|nr:hypothetical protein AQV86_02480 [Nanohaloarchaea archaeon SG9]
MAMSLDYIGKLVIILVVIAVSIGMITEFRDQINNTTPTPGNGNDDPGLEIVQVESSNSLSKVANLITLCHQRSLEQGYEDLSCFIARIDSGSFDLESSEIENELNEDTAEKVEFKASTYDRDSIIIQYEVASQKVIVEK